MRVYEPLGLGYLYRTMNIRSGLDGLSLVPSRSERDEAAARRQAALLRFLSAPEPESVENYFRELAHVEGLDGHSLRDEIA